VRTVDEAAAAYGGLPELLKAFGLNMAKCRANSAERCELPGVPRYHQLGPYLVFNTVGTRQHLAPSAKSWEKSVGDQGFITGVTSRRDALSVQEESATSLSNM
jgi:hypothetical protein